jgi:hypothetical protein
LSANELSCVGKLVRSEIASPFHYLSTIFEEVYNAKDPDAAFARLPDVHAYSLRFVPVENENVNVPRAVIANTEARRLWVKDELSGRGNKAFWTLLGEHVPDVIDKSLKDEARELAAA